MRHLMIAVLMLIPAQAAELRITVYDQAHLPRPISEEAFGLLRQMLKQAGIEAQFVAGDPSAAEAALITSPATPRRGSERETACRARRDIALEIVAATSSFRKDTLLGMAVPLATEGLNARVFDDHIRDAAQRENRSYAAVLAHAVAHEIGHVLLRTSEHSGRGLMSSTWTDLEYGWLAHGLMFFTGGQAKTMRASLTGEGCTTATTAEVVNQREAGRR